MEVACAHCGASLNRPPSRVRANIQFCDHACHTAYQQRSRVEVQCAVCGEPFTKSPSYAKRTNADTCSSACRVVYLGQSRARLSGDARNATCAHCEKPFTRKPSQIAKYPTSFCSRECKRLGQKGPHPERTTGEWLPCEVCGKDVWRTAATRKAHVYCGARCQRKVQPSPALGKPGLRGDRSPNWRGGKSLEPYTEGWGRWRSLEIRRRDGFRCRACHQRGTRKSPLLVHHVDMQKFDHSDANLITLCRTCHMKAHNGTFLVLRA